MRAVLFDLDDTLYPEIDFVRGGFRAAATYLARRTGVRTEALTREMMRALERDGRGHVFDSVLDAHGLRTSVAVQSMLVLYRSHRARLQAYPDVAPTLRALRHKGFSLGIVTDGLASVQRRKVAALKLDRAMDVVVCTDELTGRPVKPSPVAFQVALDLLGADAEASAYVGNDPGKDFGGPKHLGMTTVRVRRQTHKGGIPLGDGEDADVILPRLTGLPAALEKRS